MTKLFVAASAALLLSACDVQQRFDQMSDNIQSDMENQIEAEVQDQSNKIEAKAEDTINAAEAELNKL